MGRTHVRYKLKHEGGASDEVCEMFAANVPRVGEYVTIGTLVNQEVYDINWEVGDGEELATVWLVCRGNNECCEWDCSRHRSITD